MIPPIDPATLAAIMGGNGVAGGPSAMSAQGLLANTNFNNLPINAAGNVQAPSLASNVSAAMSEPVDLASKVGITGQSLGDVVGAPNIPSIPEGVPAPTGGGMQMPSMDTLKGIFDQGTAATPMAESPQARASGYSEAAPQQANPYASAAANQGLLQMLQKAYSLGA
jgi:hypothetical protein